MAQYDARGRHRRQSGRPQRRHAADGGRLRRARRRWSRRCSPRAPTSTRVDRLKKNAMTYAAGEGHTEIVQMLLAQGVDPNGVYNNDLTALMWAAGFGKTATVRALLDAGARAGSEGQPRQDRARHGARGQARRNRRRCWRARAPVDARSTSGVAAHAPDHGRAAVRSPSARAARRDRRARASARRRRAARRARRASSSSRDARALRKSLSATFLPAQLGSVMPKYFTG